MHILLTGGAGYIGSVLVPLLLKDGQDVTVIDNFMYKQTSLLDVCYHPKLKIIQGDIRNKDLMKRNIKNVDAIFPLACFTGAPICDRYPKEARSVIVEAIRVLLKLRSKNQTIIYPTTNSGYGIGQKDVYCTEETPLRPVSLYGRFKVEAEKMILGDGNSITLRLATAFGVSPRMRLDLLVNDFVYRAVNDGFMVLFEANFKRNYIHVRDVASAFIHCIHNFNKMKDNVYNVGLSNANLSKIELCEEIKKQIPGFYFIEANVGSDPDKRNYVVSNDKIEKAGFKARISLSQGIKELIKGYQIIKNSQFKNV